MPFRPTAAQALTLPASRAWWASAFGNNTFVITANATAAAAYSTDNGASWSASTLATTKGALGLGYGNGVFIGVPYGGSNAASRSTDNGATWSTATLPISSSWIGVATDGAGHWVATQQASASQVIAYSGDDGATWSSATGPTGNLDFTYAAYGEGVFVVARGDRLPTRSTDNGATWSSGTSFTTNGLYQGIAYGNGAFVAVSYGPSRTVMRSTDAGLNWTFNTTALPVSDQWQAVNFVNGVFIAWAATTNAAWSVDGTNWQALTMPSSATWHWGAFGNGVVVGVSATGTAGTKVGLRNDPGTARKAQAVTRSAVF